LVFSKNYNFFGNIYIGGGFSKTDTTCFYSRIVTKAKTLYKS
jgi:hypothetical protein